ncbi:hypothetical protein HMPREF9994_01751 [Staphylococcus epidermidis NIHLM088]|nr:hypothetical protein HMPREF9994_01751 [Staphylococcus epidermidis NIHLM088]
MQKLTNGKGVEHIVEVVGGSSIAKSIDALAFQGHIYVVGFLENMEANVNLFALLAKQARIQGINILLSIKSSYISPLPNLYFS